MDAKLTEKLKAKYDKLFINNPKIWCDNGWYSLIDNMCSALQYNIVAYKQPQITITQIKEKWGGLQIYTDACDEFQRGVISLAYTISHNVCEKCGIYDVNIVSKTNSAHVQSLCPICSEEIKDIMPTIGENT